jgi:hypothetical protein
MRARILLTSTLFAAAGCAAIAGTRDDLVLVSDEPTDAAADAPLVDEAGVTCREGQTVCSGSCVTLATDPLHCGACGEECRADRVCDEGKCSSGCGSNLTNCSGSCVNLQSDAEYCGSCGTACAADQTCTLGVCVASLCQGSLTRCGALCVDTTQDPRNCGECDKGCGPRQRCQDSTCVAM